MLAANLVVVDRQLACVAWEGDRQASARFGDAENDFGDGLAALHARAWRPQQCGSTFGGGFVDDHAIGADHTGRQHHRLGAHEHHDQWLAGFASYVGQRLEQCVLPAEQFQRAGGAALSDELDHIADHGDNQIGLSCILDGFVDHGLVHCGGDADFRSRLTIRIELAFRIGYKIHDIRTAGVDHVASCRCELLERIEHGGDHVARMAVRHPIDLSGIAGPITQLGLCVVGERADHGDAFRIVCGERQGSVVLKQRHGFASQLEVEPLMLVGADDRVDTFLIR